MPERIALLFTVLSLSVWVCAQEGTVEHRWIDKTNTEMYASYLLQHAYYEQGYWEWKVEIRQAGTKRIFVVQPGPMYVERFDVSHLGDLPEEAMADTPRVGDVYSPDRVNEWIATIEKRYGQRVNWASQFDRAHAQALIEVKLGEDTEQTIADIERLERIFAVPDTRPLNPSDIAAANRRQDDMLAHSPWFRLWQHFGVCCRGEAEGGLRIQS